MSFKGVNFPQGAEAKTRGRTSIFKRWRSNLAERTIST
jgi:hypothetical protein